MNPAGEVMPDPDAIKMFVGQIPKNWIEADVRQYFQEFGQIFLVNVLRDKATKQSRGCCFITYYKRKSALDAQNACHNLKTLPGMNHPIQMKPADNENRAERKIFVGMISKKLDELSLRSLFCRFGLIEECSILRDPVTGQSRGCGFVTFSSKACALTAIKTMHHSTTMEGCGSPIVVKFADVQRDKNAKDALSLLSTLNDPVTSKTPFLPPMIHLLQGNASTQALQPDLATLQFLASLASATANGNAAGQVGTATPGTFAYNFPAQIEGPEGANLFIYHLPQEFTDSDMVQTFLPFGTILSAKVFIDKQTNLSKCFGFVSYDNSLSAHLAIQTMNGFQIGPKRLKVQLKRAKDKPY